MAPQFNLFCRKISAQVFLFIFAITCHVLVDLILAETVFIIITPHGQPIAGVLENGI